MEIAVGATACVRYLEVVRYLECPLIEVSLYSQLILLVSIINFNGNGFTDTGKKTSTKVTENKKGTLVQKENIPQDPVIIQCFPQYT